MTQQIQRPRRTDGIRAFLRAVEDQLRAVESGRLVMFGARRHGFTRDEQRTEGQQNQTNEAHHDQRVEREG